MLLGNFIRRALPMLPGTAIMGKGGPGIGKTEAAIHYFMQGKWAIAKFIAAQETPESVAGFLWINPEDGSCSYKAQRRLVDLNRAMEKGQKAVLIIDEFKGGDRMTHNALQQLVREHEVGDWIAKGYMYVVALTNREEDRANVVRLTAPMINRMEQVNIEPDFDFWRGWASTQGLTEKAKGKDHPRMHPDVLGWLGSLILGGQKLKTEKAKEWAKDKNLLFCSPAPSNEEAFPTPRSHEIASDILYDGAGEDDDFIREMLGGCIGVGSAFELVAWLKVGKEAMQHVDQVINGKSIKGLDVGMQFFVNSQLTARYAVEAKKTSAPITKYLAEIESEYAMLLINDLATINDAITKDKEWFKVVQKHKKVAIAGKK